MLEAEWKEWKPGPEQQWYNEGAAAFEAGKDRHSCPYQDEGMALAWDEGWEVAAQYAEAEKL